METRKLRIIGPELAATPFEAVVVKDEPADDSFLNENPAIDAKARTSNVRKSTYKIKKPPKQKPPKRKSRAIQVCSEDIDCSIMEDSKVSDGTEIDEPIIDLKPEPCPNLCRFCLRQASRENLIPINATYRAKALTCLRIRIFYRESFKMACFNCLNLLDMLADFKDAVTKAKKLLAIQKGHMESEEWDTAENVEAFNNCKTIVETHRQQIDSLYDKYVKFPEDQICDEPRRKCVVKSEEEQSSVFTDEITKLEFVPDLSMIHVPPEVESSSFMMQDAAVGDGNNSLNECEESDDDYQPDAMDEADEDYVPEKETENNPGSRLKADEENGDDDDEDDDKEDEDYDPKKKPKKEPSVRVKDEAESDSEGKSTKKNKITKKCKFQLCDICGDSLYPSAVEAHKNQHLGIKPYTCSEEGCGLTFHSRYNLKGHMTRTHTTHKGETHVCNICGQVIRGRLCTLKYHQRRHNITEKNHVCQVCGKAFTMKWYLTQHSIVHSGEMPHKCSYCGKRFNNKWSMKTHEKNVHEKNNHSSAVNGS